MANEVLSGPFLHKRGETAKVAAYTGPAGELVVDLGKKTIAVQDGSTAGGFLLVKENRAVTPGTGIKINNGSTAVDLSSDLSISADLAGMVSAKTGNQIAVANGAGEDGLLYVPAASPSDLVDSGDELLWINGAGKLASGIELAYDTTTGKFDITNHAGTIIATVTVPSSVSMLQSAELVVNPVGQTAGTYIHFVFKLATGTTSDLYVDVTSLIDVYTAGDGVDITSNVVSVKLTANGGLEFDAVNKTLQVKKSDLVSSKSGNRLATADGAGEDGGLFVEAQTVVSGDTGNIVQEGTDGGALVTLAASNNAAMLDASNNLIVPLDCGVL